jgi:uncharacterized protein (TIGR02145 family)
MSQKSDFYISAAIFLSSLLTNGCEKTDMEFEAPADRDTVIAISHFDIFHVHQTRVRGTATIFNPGETDILQRGICWSEINNPTIYDNITVNGSGAGSFITAITGLTANTTYYARAYVIHQLGTVYGEDIHFNTTCKELDEECRGNFTDNRDGKEYRWIKIGIQVWMAENLAYLPSVRRPEESSLTDAYYYVFDYFGTDVAKAKATSYYKLYGVYYNWTAATQGASASNAMPSGVRGVCPAGWHLPGYAEWVTLNDYVSNDGHPGDEGTVLKSISGWVAESGNGTDDYGFTALPSGGRNELNGGSFGSTGENGHWWSSSDDSTTNGWMLDITSSRITAHSNISDFYTNKNFAFAVRCVKD